MAGNEILFNCSYILSETDDKGMITFVSDSFCQVAGYTQIELIGKPHNIVRHPDMPKIAFKGLWDDLRHKGFWRGIVKNLAKNGDYYWVDAMALRKIDYHGKVTFASVRTSATRAQIEWADALYKTLR
ncbi:MAG: hypothetical protein RL154_167 [Pseudomonadota bacterium]|jgi:aerotaxis receptor